jgi:hypothetical protein
MITDKLGQAMARSNNAVLFDVSPADETCTTNARRSAVNTGLRSSRENKEKIPTYRGKYSPDSSTLFAGVFGLSVGCSKQGYLLSEKLAEFQSEHCEDGLPMVAEVCGHFEQGHL